jgi:hypothetical protein
MKKGILLYLVIILISLPICAYSTDQYLNSRKDPILAGALSWYVPGLGQIYSGAFLKGISFFVVEEALLIGTVLAFFELKLDVTGDINIGLNIKSKENPDRAEQRIGVILGTAFVAVHFLNVIDAVNTSRNFNRSLEETFRTEVGYSPEKESYSLEFNRRF